MVANRGSSLVNCMPEREAKASEMSPSRFDCVDVVATLRTVDLDGVALLARRQPARQVESILLTSVIRTDTFRSIIVDWLSRTDETGCRWQ